MSENTQIVTVLTGDLVNSTALGAEKVEMAFERLQEVAKDLEAWHGGSLLFTRHRGDGWQVVLREPKYALRSVLAFRAGLRSYGPEFDTYIGVGTGPTSILESTNLNEYTDKAFELSGAALETAKKTVMEMKLASWGNREFCSMLSFADYMSASWTATQSATMYQMLVTSNGAKFTKVAKKLGKSRQAVTKSSDGAGYPYLFSALHFQEYQND